MKIKLYENLERAIRVIKGEGERVIKHYSDIDYYINKIGFGRKKDLNKAKKSKNITVDILKKKQQNLNSGKGREVKVTVQGVSPESRRSKESGKRHGKKESISPRVTDRMNFEEQSNIFSSA